MTLLMLCVCACSEIIVIHEWQQRSDDYRHRTQCSVTVGAAIINCLELGLVREGGKQRT